MTQTFHINLWSEEIVAMSWHSRQGKSRCAISMKFLLVYITFLVVACNLCSADLYIHNPRGSNNRLNEATATRTDNNRLFDSQNNARGGYNVGDSTDKAAGNRQDRQYRMVYYQSGNYLPLTAPAGRSELVIEWTNQHGCGGNEDDDPHKQNCNIVIQAMCQDESDIIAPDDGITLRDGSSTGKQNYNEINENSNKNTFESRKNQDVVANKGLQEPWYWYDNCKRRERNKGLFTADQNLNNDDATSTRQNPGGARSGYECPEERDYFPYWHPTPFVDIAVLAQNASLCPYYEAHSANRAPKYRCIETFGTSNDVKHFSTYNNQADCEENGGEWTAFYAMLELAPSYANQAECESNHGDGLQYKWGKPYNPAKFNAYQATTDVCFVQPLPIDCKAAEWSRSNHLGNGREGLPLNYTWILPYFPSETAKRCILRMRYNISTDDYDPYNTDSSSNGDQSPVEQNPLVDVGANAQALRLALNTAQTGRTFQDRSHVFILKPREENFEADARIINLNVRGKRGNIVQTFPAVEYDFVPNRLDDVRVDKDYIHVQWTGSNTHNNGGNGGDGQAGGDGQGNPGTDRHNMLQSKAPDTNYPLPYEAMTMFKDIKVIWSYNGEVDLTKNNIELILATAGYYECFEGCGANSVDTKPTIMNNVLNNAPASFPGIVFKYTSAGEHYYICTRNNAFTNRSQKGHIIVK